MKLLCVCMCVHESEREREIDRESDRQTERERGKESDWNPFVACSVATFLPVACFSVNSVTCGICRIVIIFLYLL